MSDTDLELLQCYTRNNSQDSFATLVNRHLNLVFSAAMRQVRLPQLAEEVAQSVFADLAQSANKLKPDTILTAWLYEVTRRTAIDFVRRESRRQLREKIAHELTTMNATADDWTEIEPFLDEAMHALDATDRAAVLLRYFENKTLREVGETLGTSDDAAQKRVSRAVEKLREFFTKRGVTVGASGLVVVVSANAVQAAPIGLALTISAATLAGTITATLTTHTTMNWINIKSIGAIVAAAVTAGTVTHFVQQREANRLRSENQNLIVEKEELIKERDAAFTVTTASNDEAQLSQKDKSELLRLRGEVGGLRRQVTEFGKLQEKNNQLRQATTTPQITAPVTPTEKQAIQVAIDTKNAIKQLVLSMKLYAHENNGEFATNFDQLRSELPPSPRTFPGGIKLDTFEFVPNSEQVKESMPEMIIFRERVARQTWDGKWGRTYGFASGDATEQISDDGDFSAWEKQHMISSPSSNK